MSQAARARSALPPQLLVPMLPTSSPPPPLSPAVCAHPAVAAAAAAAAAPAAACPAAPGAGCRASCGAGEACPRAGRPAGAAAGHAAAATGGAGPGCQAVPGKCRTYSSSTAVQARHRRCRPAAVMQALQHGLWYLPNCSPKLLCQRCQGPAWPTATGTHQKLSIASI